MVFTRVLAAVVTAGLAPSAEATDRFFPDSWALSPNGHYRIDAKSPDNAGGQPRPFASNFTYTLTETATGKVMWQRKQPMGRDKGSSYASPKEPSPVQVFVTDQGVVAARTAWDSLMFLDAKDGRKRAEADVLKAFPQAEHDKFVAMTTAGPMWSQESDWFFLELPTEGKTAGELYFVVRPFWNGRLVIDAATGKHVQLGDYRGASSNEELAGAPAVVSRLLRAVIADESRRATEALAGAVPKLQADDKEYRALGRVRSALRTVAFLKLKAAEPHLRAIEQHLAPCDDDYSGLMSNVREALRALGQVPAPGCGVRLYPYANNGTFLAPDTDRPFKTHVAVEERTANAGRIVVGMSVKEVTDMIGCPDARLFDDGHCYDYDIDAPSPYTLRIFLDRNQAQVEKVKTVTPFAFLHDEARMRGY